MRLFIVSMFLLACGLFAAPALQAGCCDAKSTAGKPSHVAKVEGVSDKEAAAKVQTAVAAVEGVATVKVCEKSGKVFITVKAGSTVTEAQVKAAVEGAGATLASFKDFSAGGCCGGCDGKGCGDKGGCGSGGCGDKGGCGEAKGGCGEKKDSKVTN